MANILKTLELTQEEYNNLEVKDNDTMYITEYGIYIGNTLMTDRVKLLNEISNIQTNVNEIDGELETLQNNVVTSVNGQTGDVTIDDIEIDTTNLVTKEELPGEVASLTSSLASTSYVDSEIDKLEATIPNISGLASTSYVDSEIDKLETSIPDITGLATKQELNAEVEELSTRIDNISSTGGGVTSVNGQTGDVTLNYQQPMSAGKNISITNNTIIEATGYKGDGNHNIIINDLTNNSSASQYTFVQGYNNKINASSNNSVSLGSNHVISHSNSILSGNGLKSVNPNCTVIGRYNNPQDNWNAVLWVGMGSSDTDRKNALIIQNNEIHYRGQLKEGSGWMGDIGEYFEWYDGNILDEDRVGYMVQLKDGKIEYATDIDNCIGVVSDTCILTGGACSLEWHGMYLKDKFGRDIYEEVNGEMVQVKNPDYDESLGYISRDKRKEWCKVGIVGQVIVRQDGTLESGSYVNCINGIATKSAEKTSYRVVKVIDDTVAIILVK